MRRLGELLAIAFAMAASFALPAAAQNEQVIYNFRGQIPFEAPDGSLPYSSLIFDSAGALYGTTLGGTASAHGTVFKLTPPSTTDGAWIETQLYSFCSKPNCRDGLNPYSSLFMDGAGALYGTTFFGGEATTLCGAEELGCGTAFKLTPPIAANKRWTESELHRFNWQNLGRGGALPASYLLPGPSGVLYGTTSLGGNSCGTVFELAPPTPGAAPTQRNILYKFCTRPGDGSYPDAGLITDSTGALYGTTSSGGAFGHGTVFKLTPPGAANRPWTLNTLYSFCSESNCADGDYPYAALIGVGDPIEELFGTTVKGGASGGGSVFMLWQGVIISGTSNLGWIGGVLYSFCSQSNCSDGQKPYAGLVRDSTGALYGTTYNGGAFAGGTVFKLTPPAGVYALGTPFTGTTLYSFCSQSNCSDGKYPMAGFIADKTGALFGTTSVGGAFGSGTVFEITGTGFAP